MWRNPLDPRYSANITGFYHIARSHTVAHTFDRSQLNICCINHSCGFLVYFVVESQHRLRRSERAFNEYGINGLISQMKKSNRRCATFLVFRSNLDRNLIELECISLLTKLDDVVFSSLIQVGAFAFVIHSRLTAAVVEIGVDYFKNLIFECSNALAKASLVCNSFRWRRDRKYFVVNSFTLSLARFASRLWSARKLIQRFVEEVAKLSFSRFAYQRNARNVCYRNIINFVGSAPILSPPTPYQSTNCKNNKKASLEFVIFLTYAKQARLQKVFF